mmetsp:Transcript_91610/g.179434  ORF Transcript_91610/g.179434 Transcript_91610/m.179434 type:complete len:332 (-) Transcript_91610:24-1019(-)
MFLAQIARAVIRLVVAQDVTRVEVVVLHQVGLEEHALNHHGEVVRAVEAQGHLAFRHTGKAATTAKHDVIHKPGDSTDGVGVVGDHLLKSLTGGALLQLAADEAEAEQREKDAEQHVGHVSGGTGVHEGLDGVHTFIPKLLRRLAEQRAQLGRIHLLQQLHVGLGEDLEESLEFQLDDGNLLELGESDLAEVEINSSDHGTLDDVIKGIATSRSNGDHVILLGQVKHTVVHAGILPADIVDVSLVKKLKHQLVVDLSEHPDERSHGQKHQTQDRIGNRVELVVHELAAESRLLLSISLGHFAQTGSVKGSLLTESTGKTKSIPLEKTILPL